MNNEHQSWTEKYACLLFPYKLELIRNDLVIGYVEYYDHSNDVDSRNSPNLWRVTNKEGHYKFSTLFVRWYKDHSLFSVCAHHVEIASGWVHSETNQVVCSNSFSTRYILAMALKFFIGFLCIN